MEDQDTEVDENEQIDSDENEQKEPDEDEQKEPFNPDVYFIPMAYRQSLKLLLEQQKPFNFDIEGCLGYYTVCKERLNKEEFHSLMALIESCHEPNFDVSSTLTEICRVLHRHPDLIQGFGMMLPPDLNLMMQSGDFLPFMETSEEEEESEEDCENEEDCEFVVELSDIEEVEEGSEAEEGCDVEEGSEGEEGSEIVEVSEGEQVSESEQVSEGEEVSESEEVQEEEVEEGSSQSDNEMETSTDMEVVNIQEDKDNEEDKEECKEPKEDKATKFWNKVKERFEDQPQVLEKFEEALVAMFEDDLYDRRSLVLDVGRLLGDNDDLVEEFLCFLPIPNRDSDEQDSDEAQSDVEENENNSAVEYDSSDSETSQVQKRFVVDSSIADVFKYGSHDEHKFFDDVREAVGYKEVYDNFLRCLHMFNEDYITRYELIEQSVPYLGRHPSLLQRLKEMLGYNENGINIEKIPMKICKLDNERRAMDDAEEDDIGIGYSFGGRTGTNYRALPKDFEQPVCSGRSQLCNEVLNDRWVSFPSWSEDSTFVTSCKTQYEEIIYRCEDERFELDMAITANQCTMQVLQDIQKKMNKMTFEERQGFTLDDSLNTGGSTVLHQRSLHRMYGDKTQELVEGLKRNPWVAVPIILKRLKGKDEEWKEKQRKFNDTWRNQIDLYYLRSLDHQGINFKQNDCKSFRAKNILSDMEMVYTEKKEQTGFKNADHVLNFSSEGEVFQDAIDLMLQYLKKLPGVVRDDRQKIERVIRSLIPDIFNYSRCTLDEEDEDLGIEEEPRDVVEEIMEVEEVRQEEEQRSGQTTPTDSNREGEEILSDLDESNSNETDNSEESEKSFVEEIDVFEKIDPLPPTLLPYTLFFADSTWYVFFRQFHIICERLSRLYSESSKQNQDEAVARETYLRDDEIMELEVRPTPTYRELLDRLRLLLSGTIDYSQFEEESRSLFGIHAFVSFTMDKLVLSIVRQLQHVVTTESSKRATDLFIQNLKTVESAEMTSPIEASHLEHTYLNKVKKVLEEERCFKVVWLKQEKTLTIEILEQDSDDVYDPVETENWSNYVDNFVNPSVTCEEYLEECEQPIPVILPRNLRKMKAYWKNKVANVEVSWQQRQTSQYIKKNIMTSKKRKALVLLSRSLTKMSRRSSIQEGSVKSASSKAPSVVDDDDEEDAQEELKQRSDYVGTARRRLIPIEDSKQPEECEVVLHEESVQCDDVEVETSLEVANPNIPVMNEELVETASEELTKENLKQSQETTQEDIEKCLEEDVDVNSEEGVLDTSQEEPEEVMDVEKSSEEAPASSQRGESTEGEASETVAIEGECEEMPVIVEEAEQVIGAELDLPSRTEASAESAATKEIESQEQEEENENVEEEGQESEYEELEEEQNEDEELVVEEEQNEEVQEEEQKETEELEEDQEEEEEEKQNENEELQDQEDVLPEDEQCPSSPETTDQQESTAEEETPPKRGLRSLRRKPFDYSIRTRKNRANQAKKRMKRGIIRTLQSRRRKRRKLTKPKALDVLDDPKFDYNYFCELSEKEKLHYLLFLNVDVQDDIEVSFKPGCYKMHFVHGCDLYFYRGRSFTRTREVHQSISEIKTSNFNAWLRIWQERFVAPVLLKSCHDWLMKSEPGNYMMWRMNVGDCTKPPYIPYYKYKMRFFKKKLL